MEELTRKKIDIEKLSRVAEILKTIAHPIRLAIVEALDHHDSLSVSELMKETNTEQSLLSHHLIKMKDKGVLKSERRGKSIYYELTDKHITNIFDCMANCSFVQ